MGNIEGLERICGDIGGQTLFKNPTYMKLPYDNCWFDFNLSINADRTLVAPEAVEGLLSINQGAITNTKEAILVNKITETAWLAVTFTYTTEHKRWIPGLLPCLIFVGGVGHLDNRKVAERYGRSQASDEANILHFIPDAAKYLTPVQINAAQKEQTINYGFLEQSLMLLNCKNITTENHEPPTALNKSRRKKSKQELFSYKTLKLILPGEKNKYGQPIPSGEHNRIHLCRGHFKEYTEDLPLFGKYTGLYWWQSHVRGQNKEGMIVKDYQIKQGGITCL